MSKILKRKWKNVRREFKRDIKVECMNNSAFAMMIIETYAAKQSRKHIMQIWELLGHHHRVAYNDYCDKLMGKYLTGRSEIMKSLYFANRDIYEKYNRKIPECYAMGDAYGIALKILQSK